MYLLLHSASNVQRTNDTQTLTSSKNHFLDSDSFKTERKKNLDNFKILTGYNSLPYAVAEK